jgi:hypothetical protein
MCRVGKICHKNKSLIKANELIGLIGVMERGKLINDEYYVTLWDHRLRKIRYGDYDIIEIHNNKDINDYDFVISKVITFFYNEIDRYKPLKEVDIRIIGDLPISENTLHLLQKHFSKLEFIKL